MKVKVSVDWEKIKYVNNSICSKAEVIVKRVYGQVEVKYLHNDFVWVLIFSYKQLLLE